MIDIIANDIQHSRSKGPMFENAIRRVGTHKMDGRWHLWVANPRLGERDHVAVGPAIVGTKWTDVLKLIGDAELEQIYYVVGAAAFMQSCSHAVMQSSINAVMQSCNHPFMHSCVERPSVGLQRTPSSSGRTPSSSGRTGRTGRSGRRGGGGGRTPSSSGRSSSGRSGRQA